MVHDLRGSGSLECSCRGGTCCRGNPGRETAPRATDARARGLLPARWQPSTVPSARPPALTLADIPVVPWLDLETTMTIQALVVRLIATHPDITAIVLFGSVARHTERPLADPSPSDVDVLVLYEVPAISDTDEPQSGAEANDRALEEPINKTAQDFLGVPHRRTSAKSMVCRTRSTGQACSFVPALLKMASHSGAAIL